MILRVVPGPLTTASPENLLKIKNLRPSSRPTELEPLGWQSEICVFTSPGKGDSDVC